VPRWRESDVFTPLERDVMEYAEADERITHISTIRSPHKLARLDAASTLSR
jgi:hypothetical protein